MKNACFDNPRKSDFPYSEVFWDIWNVPFVKFPREDLFIPNQWEDEEVLMSCTRQWLANITNWNNLINQWQQDFELAKKLWIEYCKINPSAKTDGASLQSSVSQFLEKKLIAWYTTINTIDEWKSAIDSGKFIFTGSNNADWSSVRKDKLYKLRSDSKIVWHAFSIIDYDDNWFIWLNSYWANNWYFTIPFDLFTTLFTRYAISDWVDEDLILKYKAMQQQKIINEAIELWITNWTELERPILRRECILMVMRMYNILKNEAKK